MVAGGRDLEPYLAENGYPSSSTTRVTFLVFGLRMSLALIVLVLTTTVPLVTFVRQDGDCQKVAIRLE